MKLLFRSLLALGILASSFGSTGSATPLSSAAKEVIPADVQQIISVDYRQMKNSPTALALKEKVMPQPLKDLEKALKGVGIDPDKDVDSLAFATFKVKEGLSMVGVAQGNFPLTSFKARLVKQKIKGLKYHTSTIYPMGESGLSM